MNEELQITEEGSFGDLEADDMRSGSESGASQSTDPLASANQETQSGHRQAPGLLLAPSTPGAASPWRSILLALAVAIPVSMLLGALIALVIVLGMR